MSKEVNTRKLASDAKFFESYSRWIDEVGRYETWDESVDRVMDMHKKKYASALKDPQTGFMLTKYFEKVDRLYKEKRILGAQRALQFGGEQMFKHNFRLYNCVGGFADKPEFFGEFFYILLCGCGAGFSVQKHHVAKMPPIAKRTKGAKIHVIEDSIEGWAKAADVLMSSYFVGGGKHPEYEGRRVFFDTTKIRPKGAKISGGFKAPGPEALRLALSRMEEICENVVAGAGSDHASIRLRPIHIYDIAMHEADAVISGGVRRAATICIFSPEDEEMLSAKSMENFNPSAGINAQRARSNNSVALIRNQIKRDTFTNIFKVIKAWGEPGFIFVDHGDQVFNPCVEIGFYPVHEKTKLTGWQGCNLSEINGERCLTEEEFYEACEAASIIGTLQAGYTDFKFVSDTTREIFEREALIGVSVTGWANNPDILFNEEIQRKGADIVMKTNKAVAKLIGINPAARGTCGKPAGNASTLLMTAPGIHGEHSPRYIRNVQMNKEIEVAKLIKEKNPYMVEESIWSANKSDYMLSFPVISPEQSKFRKDFLGTEFLDEVKRAQQNWIEFGTDVDIAVDKTVRNNISNTVTVLPDGWDEIEQYLFDNRQWFTGVSFVGFSGDKDYYQAPYTEVKNSKQIIDEYGDVALFASGLIVGSMVGFRTLWEACSIAQMTKDPGNSQENIDARADWIRRFQNFARNYFHGNTQKAEYCLKDVYLLHKWNKIQQNYVPINFVDELTEKKYTDIDTMSAVACSAGGEGCAI